MRYWIFVLLAIGAAILSPSPLCAQSQNAADFYRIAAKQVPTPRDEGEQHVLVNVLDAPLDAPAKAILDRGAKSLEMFDVASQIPFGTWGYDTDEPMSAGWLFPNATELADLVILRARVRAAAGDHSGVLDDAYKLALLSRRLSVEPSYPRQLQQNVLFDKAAQLAGLVLLDVKKDKLDSFNAKLNELRSPAELVDVVIAQERAYLMLHHRLIEDPYLRRLAEEGIGPFRSLFGADLQPVDVTDLLGDPEAQAAAFAATEGAFANMLEALKLAPGDREVAVASVHVQTRFAHPLASTATAMMDNCIRAGDLNAAELELLRTAINICLDEQRPFDQARARGMAGRFQFEPRGDNAFLLRWTDHGQLQPPMTLHIGPRPARPFATTLPATTRPATPP
jgi:hypothetical protein